MLLYYELGLLVDLQTKLQPFNLNISKATQVAGRDGRFATSVSVDPA